jgi:hypothetical protein
LSVLFFFGRGFGIGEGIREEREERERGREREREKGEEHGRGSTIIQAAAVVWAAAGTEVHATSQKEGGSFAKATARGGRE